MELCYDPQWLGILKSTDELTNFTDQRVKMPDQRLTGLDNVRTDFGPTQEEMEFVQSSFGSDNFRIPLNFRRTAPPEFEPWNGRGRPASLYYRLNLNI
jgi:lariat debranching enzyme